MGEAIFLEFSGGFGSSVLTQDQVMKQCRLECKRKVKEVIDQNADSLDTISGRLSFEEQIYNLILQLISCVEEENRKIRMQQQRKGIEAAKAEGKRFGRDFKFNPLDYVDICKDLEKGNISVKEAQTIIGASDTTILRMRKRLRTEGLL